MGQVTNMNVGLASRDELLSELNENIVRAADFLGHVDENLFDGHQTARDVLSHLLFWHREYCLITTALLFRQKPTLRSGSLAILNEEATCEFRNLDMGEIAQQLLETQKQLDMNLRQMKDWKVNFPFKKGCRKNDVAGRISAINKHIHHHLVRQERAFDRGEDWIKAYYRDIET